MRERPTHPDFLHLAEIALQLDANVTESGDFDLGVAEFGEITERFVDSECLDYMALGRCTTACVNLRLPDSFIPIFAGTWVDGFIIGATHQHRYPKEGLVEQGWWHPHVRGGQVHGHNPNQPATMHRQCQRIYTKDTTRASN